MNQTQPSREAMHAANSIFDLLEGRGHALRTSTDEVRDLIDDAYRPHLESHDRLRLACEAALKSLEEIYNCPNGDTAKQLRAALAQVPR